MGCFKEEENATPFVEKVEVFHFCSTCGETRRALKSQLEDDFPSLWGLFGGVFLSRFVDCLQEICHEKPSKKPPLRGHRCC